ncbi:uncharacterized protein K02A2.6-like [Triplophysa rosa]|uniref:uncharacterized protein K02A2.6-like n=1 Tax=Triplophysa rosa TaxID=992332 RepID=UPI002546273A|nr:uncharacterized protein K02A2.6-like [Triplophysa rosa]XP_057179704.1 uncharacterized protein K02A2.6-like [Triplophysa rosa]
MYWPCMNKDIETRVQHCEICQQHRYKKQKEPLIKHFTPCEPWRKVGTDLFHLTGKDYLVVMDYYSNYPEVALLSDTSAKNVIAQMKTIFARHGIPVTMVSDNGPQFSGWAFKDFENGFEHVTSSPHYPQSNGLAGKAVQIVKRLLKKAVEAGEDPHLAMLNYRSASLECGKSPAELLMGRKLRTKLPSSEHLLRNSDQFVPKKSSSNVTYNKHAKPLCKLERKDLVRVRCDGKWGPKAKVLKEIMPRSYIVLTEYGNTLRRNRRDLLKVPKTEFIVDIESRNTVALIEPCTETREENRSTQRTVTKFQGTDRVVRPMRVIVKPKRLIEEC